MAVFGWIRLSVLQRKIQGGINFAFSFSGGLRKCINKFRGALFIAFVFSGGHFSLLLYFQGGFFRSKMRWEAAEKNQGGFHDILENSGGPFIMT